MARGINEEGITPTVSPEDLPRKIIPRMEVGPLGGELASAAESSYRKYTADSATWAGDQLALFRQKAVQDLDTMKTQVGSGDPGAFTPKYLNQFDKDASNLTGSAYAGSNPVAGKMLARGLGELRATLTTHAMEWEATQRKASQFDSIQQNLDKQLPLIRVHPELADQVGSTLMDQVRASSMEPQEILKTGRQIDTAITHSAAMGLVDVNPTEVYKQLRSGAPTDTTLSRLTDPVARQQVLDAAGTGVVHQVSQGAIGQYRAGGPGAGQKAYAAVDGMTLDSDPIRNEAMKDQVRKAIQEGRGELMRQNQETHAQDVIKLEESLKSGADDPTRRAQIWGGYNNNWLSPEQTGAMLGEDERIRQKSELDTGAEDAARSAYQGKLYLDPKSDDMKRGVANVFLEQVKNNQLPMGSQQWVNLAAEWAHRTGVVPNPVMTWARSILAASPHPEDAVNASAAVERMRTASPVAFDYADDEHKLHGIAEQVNRLTDAGMGAAEAVAQARQNFLMGDKDRKLLNEKWNTARPFGSKDNAIDQVLTKQVADDPALTKAGWLWGRNPLPHPAEMQSDYETLVRSKFQYNGGNIEQAQADAAKDIGTKWGVTTMNGEPELVKWPPERMYRAPDGGPGLTSEAIRNDLTDQIQKGTSRGAFTMWDPTEHKQVPFTPDPKHVKITAIPQTETSGGMVWGLMYEEENGARELLFDKGNQPLQYHLPISGQDQQATQQRFQASQDKARADAMKRLKDQQASEADAQKMLQDDLNSPQHVM